MRKPRKKWLLVLVFIVLPLAAAFTWFVRSRSSGDHDDYITAVVEWGTMSELVGATGLLQPQEAIVASSPLSGQVVEIYPNADVNKTVKAGDPLLRLDDRLARKKLVQAEAAVRMALSDIARAEAARDVARIELQRARDWEQKELAPRWSVELAQRQLRAAEASVEAARAKADEAQVVREQAELGVELTIVRVPTTAPETAAKRSYTILDRKVVLGQLVAPPESAQLFTLVSDVSSMRVHAQVSEDDVGKVHPGLSATFGISADSDEEIAFAGQVVEIRPMPSRLHGAVFYDACIDVANKRNSRTKDWLLRPGRTVSVNIVRREHVGVWKLPAAALDIELDKQNQSEAANAKLARWREHAKGEQWRIVWILDSTRKPWPIFVRIGGKNAAGEGGISDGQYLEVLEWDPELKPQPNSKELATYPRVIIGKPSPRSSGLFEQPNLKIF
jgi:multidrug efflux pump subunit AcrA (membrane-fusion protein)